MEEEMWLVAAQTVLNQSQQPLHYTEIKQRIHDNGLVSPSLKTTLEEALFKEIQKPCGRFQSVLGQPGVFKLVKPEGMEDDNGASSTLQGAQIHPSTPGTPHQVGTPGSPRVSSGSPRGQAGGCKIQHQVTGSPRAPAVATFTTHKMTGAGAKPRKYINKAKVAAVMPPAALNEKYRQKYHRLKKEIKDLIFMNGAVCDDVARMEEKLQKAKDERRYLLARLLQHKTVEESLNQQHSPGGTPTSSGTSSAKHAAQSIAQILGEVEKRKKKTVTGAAVGNGKKKTAREILDDAPKPKPKRKLGLTRRVVHPIPLDSLGRPIFPIELGHLTVYCLGEIVPERSNYHSNEYIFPVGFCSTRVFASVHAPEERVLYTCKITESATGPQFDISPEDAPEMVFSGSSASDCHLKLLRAINCSRGSEIVPLVPQGPAFFGLSHPTIHNLIQSCPGARKCTQYKWIRFEVSKLPATEAFDKDLSTVNIDMFYMLPAFANFQNAQQAQASLRSLLTTSGKS